jgi:mRNA-degrading endonuclease RelE of RelBE toxin-antitoxin system
MRRSAAEGWCRGGGTGPIGCGRAIGYADGVNSAGVVCAIGVFCAVQIVRTNRYLKDMKRLGASAVEMARLEGEIAGNPQAGDVIPGLAGLRKIRFAYGGKGKRGGGRAIYFLMVWDDLAIMVFAYAKAAQEDLTAEQRKAALALIREMTDG